MQIRKPEDRKGEKGFTLVELAIVMIIIGLLIGGILKGQELIANAQITATIAQVKGFDAAFTTFRDQYDGMPGDLLTPNVRIANCGAVCNQPGNANSQIGNDPGQVHATLANENGAAWAQLTAADLITGVDQTSAAGVAPAAAVSIPAAEVNGSSWQVGFNGVGNLTAMTAGANARPGHYLLLDNSLAAVAAPATTASLSAAQAARIDRKIDDGQPNSGTVIGMGNAGAGANCADTNAVTGVYQEGQQGLLCGLYIRIQG